jgi:hypothetical protein
MFDDFGGMPSGDLYNEPDPFLTDLVSGFVNRGGMQLGITLFVKGVVITGTLVSEREYLEAMSSTFANQAKKSLVKPTTKELKQTEEAFDFSHLAEDVDLQENPPGFAPIPFNPFDVDDDYEDTMMSPDLPMIRHLHLKDPVILQPGPRASFAHSPISILRLRLQVIDGWMLGKVSGEGEENDEGFMPPPPAPKTVRH